jgi:hypothetical protein
MTASCYVPRVTRKMTDDERAQVNAAQRRIDAATDELETAQAARNDLFVQLYENGAGVGPTEMGRATATDRNPQGLHRTVVVRIVSPPRGTR